MDELNADSELEAQRRDQQKLKEEIDDASKILSRSQHALDFDPALLRDAVNVGLELAGAPTLEEAGESDEALATYRIPELPDSWQRTLDYLRSPRGRDEPFWEWRKRPPQPIVFRPPESINSQLVHLHLSHPFVQRIMSRFTAQGFSAHDLSRVTVVRNRHDGLARVIAFGRLSLFGPGAGRLHDQLVSVASQWLEAKGAGHLKPFADRADRKALDMLEQILVESPRLDGISAAVQAKLQASAADDFRALWPHIREEADARAVEAEQQLRGRGATEAAALKEILETQRNAIIKRIDDLSGEKQRVQLQLEFGPGEQSQQEQLTRDIKHMTDRVGAIQSELMTEPEQIKGLYEVVLRRLEPVGLVYLWPETRG